jgi:hypothetical protein
MHIYKALVACYMSQLAFAAHAHELKQSSKPFTVGDDAIALIPKAYEFMCIKSILLLLDLKEKNS